MARPMPKAAIATAFCAALAALVVTACSSGSPGSSGAAATSAGAASANSSLASSVPADIKSSGDLSFATAALGKPISYVDQGTGKVTGIEPTIVADVAQLLGLQVTTQKIAFASLVPALQTKRVNVGANGLTDTTLREGQVDFVDYATTWSDIVVKSGNPAGIKSAIDLCGKKLVVLVGAAQAEYAEGLKQSCTQGGLKAPTVNTSTDAAQISLAVETGQVDATITSHATSDSNVAASGGKLAEVAGVKLIPSYVGFIFTKGSGLTGPFQKALNELIKNGSYAKVMAQYGQQSAALSGEAPMNAAKTPPKLAS